MRSTTSVLLVLLIQIVTAWIPPIGKRSRYISIPQSTKTKTAPPTVVEDELPAPATRPVKLSGEEIAHRRDERLKQMRQKDKLSPLLTKEQLNIVFEDKHIIVVDKPAGVLSVSGKHGAHSLAQAVANAYSLDANRILVHRLGMDTSGLMMFAKSDAAVRGIHTGFRTRKIRRTYEALVCGHMAEDEGMIDLPLMMDYEHPPYVRISTDEHQENLLGLDAEQVGKKLLEKPKESITRYKVVAREDRDGYPVTRVQLTSVSGRTHQLNCHLAAMGHPIVGDRVYGFGGEAAQNGGLRDDERAYLIPNEARAPEDAQRELAKVDQVCCHARGLRFVHPAKRHKVVEYSSEPSF